MKLKTRAALAAALPAAAVLIIPAGLAAFDPWRQPPLWPALLLFAAGAALITLSALELYRKGGGSLAPWVPPENLVTTGPYRWSRNPVYSGTIAALAGEALFFTSPLILLYTAAAAAGFHLRVVRYEEPELSRLYGGRWRLYTALVARWISLPWFK